MFPGKRFTVPLFHCFLLTKDHLLSRSVLVYVPPFRSNQPFIILPVSSSLPQFHLNQRSTTTPSKPRQRSTTPPFKFRRFITLPWLTIHHSSCSNVPLLELSTQRSFHHSPSSFHRSTHVAQPPPPPPRNTYYVSQRRADRRAGGRVGGRFADRVAGSAPSIRRWRMIVLPLSSSLVSIHGKKIPTDVKIMPMDEKDNDC